MFYLLNIFLTLLESTPPPLREGYRYPSIMKNCKGFESVWGDPSGSSDLFQDPDPNQRKNRIQF